MNAPYSRCSSFASMPTSLRYLRISCALSTSRVDRLDAIHRFQHVRHRIALHREEPLHAVAHVLGGERAAIDRRLGMPAHAPPQLEDVRRVVRLTPRLGEVALDLEGGRHYAWTGLVLDQPAVRERARNLDPIGRLKHGVEHRGVPAPEGQNPAALRRLRARQGRRDGSSRQGYASEGQELTTREAHGDLLGLQPRPIYPGIDRSMCGQGRRCPTGTSAPRGRQARPTCSYRRLLRGRLTWNRYHTSRSKPAQ